MLMHLAGIIFDYHVIHPLYHNPVLFLLRRYGILDSVDLFRTSLTFVSPVSHRISSS